MGLKSMAEAQNQTKPEKKKQRTDDEVSDTAIGLAIAATRSPDINEPEMKPRNPEDYTAIKDELGLDPMSDSDIPPVEKQKKKKRKPKQDSSTADAKPTS